jgi:hypothetical protein
LFTWTCDWLQPMRFSGWRTSRNVFACLLCCTCPWTLGLTTAHAELKRVHSDAWSKGSATLSQLAADCQACKMNFYYFNAGGVCVCVCALTCTCTALLSQYLTHLLSFYPTRSTSMLCLG